MSSSPLVTYQNDLIAEARFRPHAGPYEPGAEPTLWFICRGRDLLVGEEPDQHCPPCMSAAPELPPGAGEIRVIGDLGGLRCVAVGLEKEAPPLDGMRFVSLRSMIAGWPAGWLKSAARAVQIVDWDLTHRYCGRCATPTVSRPNEHAKECPSCGLLQFPRVAPAVIVRVTRGDRILLARSPHFPAGWYSVLAGFVEAGESLEETVHREIHEEVGIEVQDVRYFGSQPWPFPHSLMVAFTATHRSGELNPDPAEIADADWYTVSDMPRTPPRGSISHQLIRTFVDSQADPVSQEN